MDPAPLVQEILRELPAPDGPGAERALIADMLEARAAIVEALR